MSRYTVTCGVPEVEEINSPDHTPLLAVEHFISDIKDGAHQYAYQVTDDVTGEKWLVDMAEAGRMRITCHPAEWQHPETNRCCHADHLKWEPA